MARTAVLTKEQIIKCAFDIINTDGFDSLTMRAIAAKLGTSTAPIYTQYSNMDAIFLDLAAYVKSKLHLSTSTERTLDPFLNIGMGIIAFALENKMIFNYFFLSRDKPLFDYTKDKNQYLDQMKRNPFLTILDDERLESLLEDMWIYTYGLATMICTGIENNENPDYYQHKLEQTGNRLISYHFFSSGKYETYIKKIFTEFSQHVNIREVFKS